MSRSIDISALEARISKEERKCEEEQLQLAKLQEEETTLRERLEEMPKAKARLTSKIGGRKANVKKMKIEAYELLRTQLTRAPSEPDIQPAARSHSRSAKLDDETKNGSSDAAGPDSPRPPPPVVAPTATSTDVKKRPRAPSPTDSDIVEVPPPMKREASPIRVTSLKLHGYTFTDALVGLGTKLA
jgi:septal ring factor EnvC (AmiA/AmiB activator)